jgi:hypothetical protein
MASSSHPSTRDARFPLKEHGNFVRTTSPFATGCLRGSAPYARALTSDIRSDHVSLTKAMAEK